MDIQKKRIDFPYDLTAIRDVDEMCYSLDMGGNQELHLRGDDSHIGRSYKESDARDFIRRKYVEPDFFKEIIKKAGLPIRYLCPNDCYVSIWDKKARELVLTGHSGAVERIEQKIYDAAKKRINTFEDGLARKITEINETPQRVHEKNLPRIKSLWGGR